MAEGCSFPNYTNVKPYQIYSTCGRTQSDLNEELFLFLLRRVEHAMQMHQNVESLNI